jgi:hypothetical protein
MNDGDSRIDFSRVAPFAVSNALYTGFDRERKTSTTNLRVNILIMSGSAT